MHRLAGSGNRILVLERGPFLLREKDNWNYHGSFKYYSSEVMFNKDGGEIRPGFSYFVGGNTKVYGAALVSLRLPWAIFFWVSAFSVCSLLTSAATG